MAGADFFRSIYIPLEQWINQGVIAFADEWRPFFEAIRWPATVLLREFQGILLAASPPVFLIVLFVLAWQLSSVRVAIFSVLSMTFIGAIGAWEAAMTTVALVATAVAFSVTVGFLVGILGARDERIYGIVRPVLDVMQTLPAFVYLVPIVMLMGIGNVPGVIVSIVYALPPMIRLTYLGIKQVPADIIEAADAFGATRRKVLLSVQIPLAMPTIMTGVNQSIMMALAMTTYAAMIAAGGLGELVLLGIGRLDMGIAAVGGISIVLIAMTLDRITQSLGQREKGRGGWRNRGPIGVVLTARRWLRSTATVSRASSVQ
jgi:glycine betaine/proline transport system permease protein